MTSSKSTTYIDNLSPPAFVQLVEMLLFMEKDLYGHTSRTTLIHLLKYVAWKTTGDRPTFNYTFVPFTAEQLRELKVSGIVAFAYLRATKEMYEDINGSV